MSSLFKLNGYVTIFLIINGYASIFCRGLRGFVNNDTNKEIGDML